MAAIFASIICITATFSASVESKSGFVQEKSLDWQIRSFALIDGYEETLNIVVNAQSVPRAGGKWKECLNYQNETNLNKRTKTYKVDQWLFLLE